MTTIHIRFWRSRRHDITLKTESTKPRKLEVFNCLIKRIIFIEKNSCHKFDSVFNSESHDQINEDMRWVGADAPEEITKKLLSVGSIESSVYLLLSNIYTDAGMWEMVNSVRRKMSIKDIPNT
ncbi:hypothetical protein YC2023_121606 [Brassica napus]